MHFTKNLASCGKLAAASASAILASIAMSSSPAQALGTVYYDIDSYVDSMAGDEVGGTKYEIYGSAWKQTSDKIFFGMKTNMPLEGVDSQYAENDNRVGWGDLIIQCQNLTYAVRFASNNGSGVSELGLYRVDSLKEEVNENGNKLANHGEIIDHIDEKGGPGTFSLGGLSVSTFSPHKHIDSLINTGTKLSGIEFLNAEELNELGFDVLSNLPGSHTIGFSFDSSELEGLSCYYYVGPECNNDIIAGNMNPESVPEPFAGLGLLVAGGVAVKTLSKSNRASA
jgi:hypothetical protein